MLVVVGVGGCVVGGSMGVSGSLRACYTPAKHTQPIELPEAPPNVRFEFHPNGCYDWGTIGWLLLNRPVNLWKYKYYIFLNSSVRGPYIPAYAKVHIGAGGVDMGIAWSPHDHSNVTT